jgi:hypothetical protein
MTYISTLHAATSVGLSRDRIRVFCATGRIPGAVKIGKTWLVPKKFKILRSGKHGPSSAITGNIAVIV